MRHYLVVAYIRRTAVSLIAVTLVSILAWPDFFPYTMFAALMGIGMLLASLAVEMTRPAPPTLRPPQRTKLSYRLSLFSMLLLLTVAAVLTMVLSNAQSW